MGKEDSSENKPFNKFYASFWLWLKNELNKNIFESFIIVSSVIVIVSRIAVIC